jgi:hypothetical protein
MPIVAEDGCEFQQMPDPLTVAALGVVETTNVFAAVIVDISRKCAGSILL